MLWVCVLGGIRIGLPSPPSALQGTSKRSLTTRNYCGGLAEGKTRVGDTVVCNTSNQSSQNEIRHQGYFRLVGGVCRQRSDGQSFRAGLRCSVGNTCFSVCNIALRCREIHKERCTSYGNLYGCL